MHATIAKCYYPVNSILIIPPHSKLLFNAAMENKEIRRENMLLLAEQRGSLRALGEATGTDETYLSNIKNRVNGRGMGDEVARRFEERLNKSVGWMDVRHIDDDTASDLEGANGYGVPVVGEILGGANGYSHEIDYPTGHGEGFVVYPTRDKNAYALRVKGDSMRPRIKPGEYIVVLPNHQLIPGEEVIVRLKDGRSMVKVLGVRRGGTVELISINETDYRPITVDETEIEKIHYVAAIAKDDLYRSTL